MGCAAARTILESTKGCIVDRYLLLRGDGYLGTHGVGSQCVVGFFLGVGGCGTRTSSHGAFGVVLVVVNTQ